MADSKKYVAEFVIDADGAIKAIDDVAVAQDNAVESSKNLKQQLRELQKELLQGQEKLGTERYAELSAQVGKLKDEIKDTAEAVNAQAGSAFENLSGSAGNLGNALMNLDIDGAGKAMKVLATNVKNVNFKSLTEGSGEFGKSFLQLGRALATNPLILIGTAIALIVMNFDKILNVVPAVAGAFKALGAVVEFVVNGIKALTDAVGLTEFAAADALDKSISDRDKALSEFDRQEKRAKAQARKNGEDITKVEEEYAQKRIAQYQSIIDYANTLTQKGTALTEDQVKAVQDAQNALFDIETQRLEREAAQAEKDRQEKEKKAEEAARIAKERAKQASEERKQREKELTAALAQIEEERLQSKLGAEDRELRQSEVKYQELLKNAGTNKELQTKVREEQELARLEIVAKYDKLEAEAKKKTQEAAKAAEQQYQDELAELESIAFEAGLSAQQKELIALDEYYFEKITKAQEAGITTTALEEEQRKKQAEINDKYNKEALDKEKAARDNRIALAQGGLQAISDLASAFAGKGEKQQKRAFEINKAVQIANALIDTYKGATSAYASQLVAGDPSSVIRGAIAAGAVVAAGLANVANIRRQKFEGGSSGGSASVSAPSVGGGSSASSSQAINSSASQFSGLNLSFLQNRPDQVNPAYVLAGEVSGAQEARKKVEDLARLNAR